MCNFEWWLARINLKWRPNIFLYTNTTNKKSIQLHTTQHNHKKTIENIYYILKLYMYIYEPKKKKKNGKQQLNWNKKSTTDYFLDFYRACVCWCFVYFIYIYNNIIKNKLTIYACVYMISNSSTHTSKNDGKKINVCVNLQINK